MKKRCYCGITLMLLFLAITFFLYTHIQHLDSTNTSKNLYNLNRNQQKDRGTSALFGKHLVATPSQGVLVREGNVQIETKHVLTPIQPQWFEQVDKYSAGHSDQHYIRNPRRPRDHSPEEKSALYQVPNRELESHKIHDAEDYSNHFEIHLRPQHHVTRRDEDQLMQKRDFTQQSRLRATPPVHNSDIEIHRHKVAADSSSETNSSENFSLRWKLERMQEEEEYRLLSLEGLNQTWAERLRKKLNCFRSHKTGIYLYHFRKTAGSSLRKFLTFSARSYGVPFFETEGKIVDLNVVHSPTFITFLSLREPIARIRSLYWYEHVKWFYENVKDPSKVVTYREWAEAWLDGSEWKKNFVAANPGNNYMEIDNYYVKALIGWNRTAEGILNPPLNESDLERAKEVLQKFDMVIITEWLPMGELPDLLDFLFKRRLLSIRDTYEVQNNGSLTASLSSTLASDQAEVENLLLERNKYDIQLYQFAQDLVLQRITKLVMDMRSTSFWSTKLVCAKRVLYPASIRTAFGIFRPPKHKGPFSKSNDTMNSKDFNKI